MAENRILDSKKNNWQVNKEVRKETEIGGGNEILDRMDWEWHIEKVTCSSDLIEVE